jgi:hypothetical protein
MDELRLPEDYWDRTPANKAVLDKNTIPYHCICGELVLLLGVCVMCDVM